MKSETTISNEMHEAQLAKIYEDIEKSQLERLKMQIDFEKAKKELKWYEVTVIVAVTLALVAIAKLFL